MKLFVAGIRYKTAPVEVGEKLAVHSSLLPCYGCHVKLGAGPVRENVKHKNSTVQI